MIIQCGIKGKDTCASGFLRNNPSLYLVQVRRTRARARMASFCLHQGGAPHTHMPCHRSQQQWTGQVGRTEGYKRQHLAIGKGSRLVVILVLCNLKPILNALCHNIALQPAH